MLLLYFNHVLLLALFLILNWDLSDWDYLIENYHGQLLIHVPDL